MEKEKSSGGLLKRLAIGGVLVAVFGCIAIVGLLTILGGTVEDEPSTAGVSTNGTNNGSDSAAGTGSDSAAGTDAAPASEASEPVSIPVYPDAQPLAEDDANVQLIQQFIDFVADSMAREAGQSDANIYTVPGSATFSEVVNFYKGAMEAAGWTLIEESPEDSLAMWTNGKDALILTFLPGDAERFVSVEHNYLAVISFTGQDIAGLDEQVSEEVASKLADVPAYPEAQPVGDDDPIGQQLAGNMSTMLTQASGIEVQVASRVFTVPNGVTVDDAVNFYKDILESDGWRFTQNYDFGIEDMDVKGAEWQRRKSNFIVYVMSGPDIEMVLPGRSYLLVMWVDQ